MKEKIYFTNYCLNKPIVESVENSEAIRNSDEMKPIETTTGYVYTCETCVHVLMYASCNSKDLRF